MERLESSRTATTSAPAVQEDQIRDYRRNQRARFLAQRAVSRFRSRNFNRSLESQINPEEQPALSQRRRANMVPAEVLYNTFSDTVTHSVYQATGLIDGSISIRFGGHAPARILDDPELDELDTELIHVCLAEQIQDPHPEITDTEEREEWGLPPLQSFSNPFASEGGGEEEPIFHNSTEPTISRPIYDESSDSDSLGLEASDFTNAQSEVLWAGIDEEREQMDYPTLKALTDDLKKETALSSVTSQYTPPTEPLMGQVNYPPATSSASPYDSNAYAREQLRTVKGKCLTSNT